MKNHYLLLPLLFISCIGSKKLGNNSLAMVGKSHEAITKIYSSYKEGIFKDQISLDINQDTIYYVQHLTQGPLKSILLFEEGICIFQETQIYCSPCADRYVNGIINDKSYKFKKIDNTNYQSKKYPNLILRVSDHHKNEFTCKKILLTNVGDVAPK